MAYRHQSPPRKNRIVCANLQIVPKKLTILTSKIPKYEILKMNFRMSTKHFKIQVQKYFYWQMALQQNYFSKIIMMGSCCIFYSNYEIVYLCFSKYTYDISLKLIIFKYLLCMNFKKRNSFQKIYSLPLCILLSNGLQVLT